MQSLPNGTRTDVASSFLDCNPVTTDIHVDYKKKTYFGGQLCTLSVSSITMPGRVAQSVGHLTRKSGVLCSIPGLATYFRFSFRFFKKGSCQLLAKVCARSTG